MRAQYLMHTYNVLYKSFIKNIISNKDTEYLPIQIFRMRLFLLSHPVQEFYVYQGPNNGVCGIVPRHRM